LARVLSLATKGFVRIVNKPVLMLPLKTMLNI